MAEKRKPIAIGSFHPFHAPLVEGTLLGRYNRFLADVRLTTGEIVTAHCVNTGRMEGLTMPGLRVWLSPAKNPKAKLAWCWEIAELEGRLVGTNTSAPNRVVGELLNAGAIPGFSAEEVRAEYRINAHSRVDFLLRENGHEHYVEVKNCHLVYPDGGAYFPDSVSTRGAKHLRELGELVANGHHCTVLFFAQRDDACFVRPSDVHDPDFAIAAREAAAAGVRFAALRVEPRVDGLAVLDMIPVDLEPYETAPPARWRDEGRALAPAWTRARPSLG